MESHRKQTWLLNGTFWPLILAWLYIPSASVISHVDPRMGNGIIAILSLVSLMATSIGLFKKESG